MLQLELQLIIKTILDKLLLHAVDLRLPIWRPLHLYDGITRKIKNRYCEAKHTPPGELTDNDVFAINSSGNFTYCRRHVKKNDRSLSPFEQLPACNTRAGQKLGKTYVVLDRNLICTPIRFRETKSDYDTSKCDTLRIIFFKLCIRK